MTKLKEELKEFTEDQISDFEPVLSAQIQKKISISILSDVSASYVTFEGMQASLTKIESQHAESMSRKTLLLWLSLLSLWQNTGL